MRRVVPAITICLSCCGRVGFDPTTDSTIGASAHRRTITIDGTKVSGGPHASFPLLVSLASDPDLAAGARPDGFDLGFTSLDGATELPYERERFDPTTGALVAWVLVPKVASNADTTILLHYGNPDATDRQQPSAVWGASYVGVWHLNEGLPDSTANRNDAGAINGLAVDAPSQIGAGVRYDGIDDFLMMNHSASLDSTAPAATLSLWINWDQPVAGHYQMVMSSSNRFVTPRNGFEWASDPTGRHYFYPWGGIEQDFNVGSNPFTNRTWQYLVVTLDYATRNVVIYVDGVVLQTTQDVRTLWTQLATPRDWLWGGNPDMGGPSWFKGSMDEIRVATTVRSPGWIATELANQRSPSMFNRVGPEQ